jgi:hypothetical protein
MDAVQPDTGYEAEVSVAWLLSSGGAEGEEEVTPSYYV